MDQPSRRRDPPPPGPLRARLNQPPEPAQLPRNPARGSRRPARRHSPNRHTHPAQSPTHSRRAAGTMINKPAVQDPG
jgi:hypothetical protein